MDVNAEEAEMSGLPAWLDTFPGLKAVDEQAWLEVAGRAQVVTHPAYTPVIIGGDRCRNFILVQSGAIRICKVFENGREMVLYHLHSGECCSLTASTLLTGGKYIANAITETETSIVLIPKNDFYAAFDKSTEFRRYVCAEMSGRFHEMLMLLETQGMRNVEGRLARWLLENRSESDCVKASHRELARELGTAREVISRHLKDFEKKGFVRLSRKYIELADVVALGARLDSQRA